MSNKDTFQIMKYLTEILPDDKLATLLNLEDIEGRSSARIAAWEGNITFLELIAGLSLLDKADYENRTPLFAACYMQHIDIGMCSIFDIFLRESDINNGSNKSVIFAPTRR